MANNIKRKRTLEITTEPNDMLAFAYALHHAPVCAVCGDSVCGPWTVVGTPKGFAFVCEFCNQSVYRINRLITQFDCDRDCANCKRFFYCDDIPF